MKTVLILSLLLSGLSTSAFADTVKCQVDETFFGGSGEKVSVPVTISKGELTVNKEVTFAGYTFSVLWYQGSKFEPQPFLAMSFGEIQSTMYDFTLEGHMGPINVIEHEGIRFQCWVDKE